MAEILVSAENLGVRRSGRWLVRGVNLAVRSGEIVTLIGPNGGGKSTTAKALLGLIAPQEGRRVVADHLSVGYMPQRFSVDWTLPLTVRRLMTLTHRHPSPQIVAALDAVGCAHLLERAVQALSGGEFQRVLLARALLRNPRLLVLDEPAQGVDVNGQAELYRLISDIRNRHQCGILLVSHDLHLVMSATDEVICLNQHVCCHGHPEQVSNDPAYLELFGKKDAETLAVYTHHHNHSHDLSGDIVDGKSQNRSNHDG